MTLVCIKMDYVLSNSFPDKRVLYKYLEIMERCGGGVLEIPIIPIECILKYNILYNKHNIYREA